MSQSSFWFWTFEHVWSSRSSWSIVADSGRRDGEERIDGCGDGTIGSAGEDVGSGGLVALFILVGNKGKILLDNDVTDGKDRMIRNYYKIYKQNNFGNLFYFTLFLYLILVYYLLYFYFYCFTQEKFINKA